MFVERNIIWLIQIQFSPKINQTDFRFFLVLNVNQFGNNNKKKLKNIHCGQHYSICSE
jgi:hypothetical protein